MGWALLPFVAAGAFVFGMIAGAWAITLAIRTANSARRARPPQRPKLRLIAGGRG